jgi:predicted acyltransferase
MMDMLYKVGRFLQVVGMILLPIAMAGNLVPEKPLDSRAMLLLALVGVGVFGLGYLIQQVGKPP